MEKLKKTSDKLKNSIQRIHRKRSHRFRTPASEPCSAASAPAAQEGLSYPPTSHDLLSVPPHSEAGQSRSPSPASNPNNSQTTRDNRMSLADGFGRASSVDAPDASNPNPVGDGLSSHPPKGRVFDGERTKELGSQSQAWNVTKMTLGMVEKVSDVFTPLKSAAAGLNGVIKIAETVQDVQREFASISDRLVDILHILRYYGEQPTLPPQLVGPLEEISSRFNDLTSALTEKRERSLLKRIVNAPDDVKVVADAIRDVDSSIQKLNIHVTIVTGMSVEAIKKMMVVLSNTALLDKLQPVSGAKRGPQRCLEGTRVKLVEDVLDWVQTQDGPPLLWLNGMAGMGKTTLATEIHERFPRSGDVICVSFFCSRQAVERQDLGRVFPTLAHDLAALLPVYLFAHSPTLADLSFDVENPSVEEQCKVLIEEPLRRANLPEGQIVLFLGDALDECDKGNGGIIMKRFLLSILNGQLPASIKFLFTSRPEAPIHNMFTSPSVSDKAARIIEVHDISTYPVREDIHH